MIRAGIGCLCGVLLGNLFFFKKQETALPHPAKQSPDDYFLYSIRMAFRTHSIATPESANTASHMEA